MGTREPPLKEGERTILRGQSCLSTTCTTWRPGFSYLTNKRLIYSQPSGRVIFEIPLERVMDVKLMKGRFILGLKRKILQTLYRSPMRGKVFQAFLAVNNPERWKRAIEEAREHVEREKHATLVDVIDRKDYLIVVAEMFGVPKKDIKVDTAPNALTINANTANGEYHKEVKLPTPVKTETAEITYKKGLLEVKLEKAWET